MEGEGGEEARDQAYQAEDREDWNQAYQADQELIRPRNWQASQLTTEGCR